MVDFILSFGLYITLFFLIISVLTTIVKYARQIFKNAEDYGNWLYTCDIIIDCSCICMIFCLFVTLAFMYTH